MQRPQARVKEVGGRYCYSDDVLDALAMIKSLADKIISRHGDMMVVIITVPGSIPARRIRSRIHSTLVTYAGMVHVHFQINQ